MCSNNNETSYFANLREGLVRREQRHVSWLQTAQPGHGAILLMLIENRVPDEAARAGLRPGAGNRECPASCATVHADERVLERPANRGIERRKTA